ncbi:MULTISPECIES: helix-turn-helix transcriptional regulator [unclassified Vibrio]|uniref:Helix-turn-helix transcriptional regulator n=1 Tax=Vibrio sp. HB236076 TaxID=3232307 RepID=A0AB39HH17_9VIBR|nr:helix-turn-helix transcriptional regulator [Vibrio sp. HB161653]MDP5254666.1 helix-turn-helix transcriptional regulator [Vibrio sp. HB161653]
MTNEDFTSENFKANLKLAVSYYPSISEMCRKLGINRQQFMKYLSGRSFPTRYNLRRICDFFGVDEYEILMPHDQFGNIIRLRPTHTRDDLQVPPGVASVIKETQRHRNTLTKMHGYYYEYYLSFTTPGHILRALTYVYGWKDFTMYKRIERLNHIDQKGRPDVHKYSGGISLVGDRVHLFDTETITGAELTQKVLYPNYRNRISMLSGLILGVSAGDTHEPSASRVLLEYIGRTTHVKQALSQCGLFPISSMQISRSVAFHLTSAGEFEQPLRATTFDANFRL